MKKLFASALILIVFCVGSISVVPVKAQAVLNVGPLQPFPTITAALAFALPGDVIHVWNNPNPYNENPVVGVPNVKIIGQSLAGVTVQLAAPAPGSCFTILAPGVTIMELTIIDPFMLPGDIGVYISPSSMQCKIWNNVILRFQNGIVIDNSHSNEIVGNDISGCMAMPGPPPIGPTAILMLGPAATNNQVRGNELGLTVPNFYAVGTNGASGNTITLNNVYWGGLAPPPQAFAMPGDINTWDSGPSGLPKGNYWSDPMGWPPPYVIDPVNLDNFCSPAPYNWAATPWDLNRDGKCSIIDVATAAAAYGTVWSNLKWNPKADVVPDGKIDIRDIATIARWFGWSDP